MNIAPKALYNSLRMNFLQNPSFSVERWKVEDYRQLSQEELFSRLLLHGIAFDRTGFVAFADEHDSPEEFYDDLVSDKEVPAEQQDHLYLVTFELWRRFVCEKQSISIICDELDYQIFLYDAGSLNREESLEDALASFHAALEENVDQGLSHSDVYEAVSEYLANDIQSFLIDYLADLIDEREYIYASELLEQLYPFMPDKKWFDLLHARIVGIGDIRQGHDFLRKIVRHQQENPDLQFNFDILSYLISLPDVDLFRDVAMHSLQLLEEETDFQELIHLSSEFFKSRDQHEKSRAFERMSEKRHELQLHGSLKKDDPDLAAFEKTFTSPK